MEEALRDGGEGERQRDAESREADTVEGTTAAPADANLNHRGSVDKSKFNTLGFQRRTKQKVVTDFATLSKGASAGAKPRAALRQVLFSQGASDKNPASEERGQLDVLKQELEAFAVPASLTWQWGADSQGTTLEKSWTEIVHSHSTMSKMQRHQQEALWEFVHTELTYINQLVTIRDLVIAALENLHQHGFLLEVTAELLFSNLPSIIDAHQLFWREVIFPMLHEVRKTGKPFDPAKLAPGCLQFQERFSSYKHYCWEEEDNLEFARRLTEGNAQFLTYIQWVETHPQCRRMRLGDMQAKPHQRITKYPLLLKAVLKTTQDPHVQHTIKGMLSSVNSFLESINDYLRLKDEELALSISAARVEGYVMEGINEEIDKHVREICQFDLTCPVRGVGPGVVRKLLLEENLKVRGRKDSKLDVVALLFSDVLLMTKVQKKGERLKVVRPPLALDRTYCLASKDSNAFVLVEVGELRCTMNVYIFAASTSESCNTWVSTIQQAKETLWNLRKMEEKRQCEAWKFPKPEDNNGRIEEIGMLKQPVSRDGESGEEISVDEPANEGSTCSTTETSAPKHVKVKPGESESALWQSHHGKTQEGPLRKGAADWQQAAEAMEGMEGEHGGTHAAEEGRITPSVLTKAQMSNRRAKSVQNLMETFPSASAADSLRGRTAGPHPLLVGGYPAVDYPLGDTNSLHSHPQTSQTRRTDHNFRSDQNTGKNVSLPRDASIDGWGFPEKLKSPGLRRRRPVSTQQGPLAQMPVLPSQWSIPARPASNNSSNSDSDCNPNVKRNSLPAGQSSDSHRVLKLGSLKPNQGMFWNMNDARVSPDPQTLSEPELPDPNAHNKRPKIKTQRSASIPNIVIQEEGRLYSFAVPHQAAGAASPGAVLRPNGYPSPLEGLLERAKGRAREHHSSKTNRNAKMANVKPRLRSPSPSFSNTPSPSPSDGDKDAEWEEEVELMRRRAPAVSQGWREQLVDGDEDDKSDSAIFGNGVNVDWAGWCFDDDEVMDHLHPGGVGLMEGISQSLSFWNAHYFSEQDDGECSQV